VIALGLFLRKVPLWAWGAIVAGIVLFGVGVHIYHAGERKVERVARADSTKAAVVVLDSAKVRLDTALARAEATRSAGVAAGHRRAAVRAAVAIVDSHTVRVAGVLDTVPAEVVALIKADDAKIAADSAHMAATDSIAPAVVVVERAHAGVDTALTHQINAGDSVGGGGHGAAVVVVLAVLGTLGALVALLHR
jgi:hypothetical protein